ncbi:hypothetical protein [Ornithinimicrobium sp. INDO-MA30-4]|uniref:hypothetical protein n=1 Tax=Ornithinimicrobium sp. INDO-MA30-4 TaxID=2908651 RepID=UPI0028832115|nr:hypothetical protein [Ornithinimicrobium sp. INDO-MA30-4]
MSYAWAEDACLRHDAYVTVLRAIHDDAMSDALAAHTRNRPVVGVMGGHALARGTDALRRLHSWVMPSPTPGASWRQAAVRVPWRLPI